MSEQMTPQEALGFLDRVASAYQGDRQTHILLQRAIEVISKALFQLPPPSNAVEEVAFED